MRGEKFANLVLTGGALLGALGLLYVVYHYDIARTRQLSSAAAMLLFHLVPAAIAVALILARWLPGRLKVNLSLLIVSIGVSLYAVDALVSVFAQNGTDPRQAAARKAGLAFDARSKLEVLIALREQGIPAYPTVTSRVWLERLPDATLKSRLNIDDRELLPLAGGVSRCPSLFCKEGGQWVIYESDEHGFHNPRGIWPLGQVDFAALGDSFAEGWCVPSDLNFMGRIRQRYPATLNLAVGGNGPLLELATLREYLPSIKPRVVLWFYFEGNDLCDLRIERHSPLLMRYLDPQFNQDLPSRQLVLDRSIAGFLDAAVANRKAPAVANGKARWGAREVFGRLTGIVVFRHIRQQFGLTARESQPPGARLYGCVEREGAAYLNTFEGEEAFLFEEILRQAQASVAAWGGNLVFVYLPEWQRYNRFGKANPHREQVLDLARRLGIPIIDVHAPFQAHGDPLALFSFRLQGHYNADGHRVVAEAVLHALSSEKK